MLIRNAEVWRQGLADVRIEGDTLAAVGTLEPRCGEEVIDARGGALLPGLHDHHVHLAGLAARRSSVFCGPPQVNDAAMLASVLALPGSGWIRAIGYHESVLGMLPDANALDALVPERPLRLQHRSGRMWLLNSRALDELLSRSDPPPGLEKEGGRFTGRLFDEDTWLRKALGSKPPDFADVSRDLASFGVTGITDMTPQNDVQMARHFAEQRLGGSLLQNCFLAGTLQIADAQQDGWQVGPAKLHLHEAELPEFDETTGFIMAAHDEGRPVAIHCVSEVELVYALATLEAAGAVYGDRIEHASVASPELVERMASLGLAVCSQPHFVEERGDRYLADVETRHHGNLYRLKSISDAGVPLAGGSDAPFGGADPWASMRAAVTRETTSGAVIGLEEALTPEEALSLYLADSDDLSCQRQIEPGAAADLCLLNRPWSEARARLEAVDVVLAIASGRIVHDRIDQAPVERLPR